MMPATNRAGGGATMRLHIETEAELRTLCEQLDAEPRRRDEALVAALREALERGDDPLGEALCTLRPAAERRAHGATYTPPGIVQSMIAWAARAGDPARVVDPGAGSGRFLLAAARAFPRARLVGIELDPLAAAVARANLGASGLSDRAEIVVGDYRSAALPRVAGATLFVGNPPYVRHHAIEARWKHWLSERARARGLPARQLSGLHVHFALATLLHASEGDFGAFITAAEWLDTNYGALARALFAGPLGLDRLDLFAPSARPFADAHTTGVIASFRVGADGPAFVRGVRDVASLAPLEGGRPIARRTLRATGRWTSLLRPARRRPAELVELGELCRVHRGQVTGANRVWIAGDDTPKLPPRVLRPAITRARELFAAGAVLATDATLRRVIDLPEDLDALEPDARRQVRRFLSWARERGAHQTYVASHRTPWWSVKLRRPAPILATYMARRPPAFVRNRAGARHINIAHGVYPRDALSGRCLDALAGFLCGEVELSSGRAYAGGLVKFEPREMERLLVPRPELLAQLLPRAGRADPVRGPGRSSSPPARDR